MMICKADFEELLPHLFAPEAHPVIETPLLPSDACIARWHDDGGSVDIRPPRETAHKTKLKARSTSMPGPIHPGMVVAPVLVALFYAPIWVMLTSYDLRTNYDLTD